MAVREKNMEVVFIGPGLSAGLRGVRESESHLLNRPFSLVLVDNRLSCLCWLGGSRMHENCERWRQRDVGKNGQGLAPDAEGHV